MSNIQQHRGHGDIRIYDVPYKILFPSLVEICNNLDEHFEIVDIDEINGTIFAEGSVSMHSMGEYIGIWVTENSASTRCKVEIDLERKMKTNIWPIQWGDMIFSELDKKYMKDF